MTKITILILALLLPPYSFGMSLTCVTSIPTTSVTAAVEGEDLIVHVIHHFGMKYMPLTTTLISLSEIEGVIQKAKTFEKLGDHYIFRWPLKNCTQTDEDLFSCSNGEETEINGVRVKPWGVYTKRIHTEIDIAELNEIEVNFNLSVNGNLEHIASKYLKSECQQSEKNLEALKNYLK